MESDLYSYLLGPSPDPQKQRMIAEQLRRRRSFGELGALTGDRVLQPFGQQQMQFADETAAQLQDTRQKDIDNAQTKSYQDSQVQHMKDTLAETKRANTFDHIYQMLMAQAAMQRANNSGAQKIPRLRQGDIKDLQDMAQDIGEFKSLEEFIKGGGKFGAHELAGFPIPGSRALTNTMARFGMGREEDKESFAAKQKFDRLYTLAARNRLFGATLTSNEQKAWDNANPQIRQSDAQIAAALPALRKVFERRLVNKVGGLTRENYDSGAIAEYADLDNLGLENPVNMTSSRNPTAAKRIKVDNEGNVIGD